VFVFVRLMQAAVSLLLESKLTNPASVLNSELKNENARDDKAVVLLDGWLICRYYQLPVADTAGRMVDLSLPITGG
jgi:hypothetical protein